MYIRGINDILRFDELQFCVEIKLCFHLKNIVNCAEVKSQHTSKFYYKKNKTTKVAVAF
jgi:hypothetical protein